LMMLLLLIVRQEAPADTVGARASFQTNCIDQDTCKGREARRSTTAEPPVGGEIGAGDR